MPQIIDRVTRAPAQHLNLNGTIGTLSVGAEADVAVLALQQGRFSFADVINVKVNGLEKFETEMTIRAGRVVWDLNARTSIVQVIPREIEDFLIEKRVIHERVLPPVDSSSSTS